MYLEKINKPSDIKKLSSNQLISLAKNVGITVYLY